ncbi:unnamed protein product [Rotaria sp. Silwood1]|nr:unnamed protein product [Rotaria sp. Silwood1]CAF4957072.1 unnamed protein product [Rotaria sp. Silwood1]
MKCSMETTDEGNVFNKFKIELRLLWAECQVDNELDFDRVAQQLFDDDLKVLEEIKENALEDKFLYFQHELLESERFKEIWKAKNLPKSNHTDRAFIEFKTVIMKIFETENIKPNTVDLDLLMQQLYQNEDQNIADLFKNILIPKKIKQLITKIQSNEALKTIWPSNMLIFGDIKSIFKKYINFGDSNEDEIKKIISELYVNADNGMKLIEDKCSSEKFSKIKSELYGNAEIRSKIFHEKNLIKLPNIDNKNNVVMLSSTTVHSAHENEQNKKFETIRELQEIMFGREDNYPDQLFTEILPLNYHSLGETIKNSLNKMSMLDMMLPYVLNKLKKGIALSEICELEIFWDEVSPLFGMDYKTIFICMIERYKRYQLDIVALIKKLGIALPFAYRWVVNQKLIFKIPLRAYSYSLDIDCPMVISLGSGCIGKSTLLNKIYSAQFITNRAGKITGGIDVIFSTPEFACGFTIFDIHDDAYEQEALLEVFFKMIPIENCWILLQSTSADEKNKIIEKLKLFGTTNGQIIWIVRDCKESTYQSTQTLKDNSQIQVLSIRKIEENNPQFNANLAVLREKLFKSTGIGHNSRKPNEINLRKESDNLYREIETRLGQQQLPGIHIDMQDESVGKCSIWTDEYLRSTDGIMDNLQAHLFKHVEFNKLIQAEEKKKAGLSGTDSQTKQTEITKIDQAKIHFSDKKASTKPSTLVCQYNKYFINKDFYLITELDKRVSAWQSPILSPLFQKRNELVKELEVCRTSIADCQTKNNNSLELQVQQNKQSDLEKEKQHISNLIDDKIINRDIFMRELLAIYGDEDFLRNANSNRNLSKKDFDKNQYISSFVDYMMKGNEIEIIDGDNNSFNYNIVSEIFGRLEATYKEANKEPPFVVSVIGPQSTGKSTLLNMLFGSNFQTSAGRCTKGLYASIFQTGYPNARTLLVLDTEGLLSIEKANEEYDKKLTLFSMASSQVMLINLNGEINSAMKKILTISLFVANQVKIFTTRPIIIFILRNMMDLNVNKQREMIDTVKKELKEVSELSKLTLSQVLDFKEEKAFFLMLSAFYKDFVYNKSEELFQKSTTNTKFAKLSQELTERIFSEAKAPDPRFKSLSDWVKQASEIWKTIDLYNDIIMIESIKEINERKELSDIVTKIMETLIEPSDEQTSYRSKLETILTQQEKLINNSSPVDSDVEQRFENETKIFQEKVKNNFENQIKSKSYAVKLTNEYKDRLLSAITTSKTQALQKFKAIAEKGKLKYKIDVALSQLQNRSEKQILDWQKAEQNTSTEHKTHLKIKIIKEFEEVMKKTISDTVKEMNTSKKTHEQWENFVMEQIKSAHGTIPVEKKFFSIATLDQKSSGQPLSENIIKIVTNIDRPNYQDYALEKISQLVQRKKKHSQINRNVSMEGITTSTENTIYIEKQSNYVKRKWTEATSWISSKFHRSGRTSQNTRQNHGSFHSNDRIINQICEAGISSEGTVLSHTMFLEMEEYLRTNIQEEILRSAEYQITGLKQNILQIEAKMSELNQKYLDEEELEFTHTFGNELIEWLYDIIVDKMFKDEQNTYEKMEAEFKQDVDKLLTELKERLDAAFGDAENATDMAKKIYDNIKKICFSTVEIEYKQNLEDVTYLNAYKLVELSNKVFYETDGNFDSDGIYQYITNMIDYMKKVYTQHFEDKAAEVEKTYDRKYSEKYELQFQNMISKLESLEQIFGNYELNQSHIKHHKEEFTNFF